MRYSVRFHPPRLLLTPELEWVFLRAYGPLHHSPPPAPPALRAVTMRRLGLGSRIASRLPEAELREEVGEQLTRELSQALRMQAARGLGLRALQSSVATAASTTGHRVLLLKFAALRQLGLVTESSRPACDLDILVALEHLDSFSEALASLGLRKRALAPLAHHPLVFQATSGLCVELHTALPYVRLVPGGRFVTLPDLQESLLVERATPELLVPTRDLLTAHLVAHGIAQHGYEPKTYPAIRLLSDGIDLGLAGNEALALDAFRWLRTDVSYTEIKSLAQIGKAVVEGRVGDVWYGSEPAARLMRHFVAAVVNETYRARLKVRRVVQVVDENGVRGALRKALAHFSQTKLHLGT